MELDAWTTTSKADAGRRKRLLVGCGVGGAAVLSAMTFIALTAEGKQLIDDTLDVTLASAPEVKTVEPEPEPEPEQPKPKPRVQRPRKRRGNAKVGVPKEVPNNLPAEADATDNPYSESDFEGAFGEGGRRRHGNTGAKREAQDHRENRGRSRHIPEAQVRFRTGRVVTATSALTSESALPRRSTPREDPRSRVDEGPGWTRRQRETSEHHQWAPPAQIGRPKRSQALALQPRDVPRSTGGPMDVRHHPIRVTCRHLRSLQENDHEVRSRTHLGRDDGPQQGRGHLLAANGRRRRRRDRRTPLGAREVRAGIQEVRPIGGTSAQRLAAARASPTLQEPPEQRPGKTLHTDHRFAT